MCGLKKNVCSVVIFYVCPIRSSFLISSISLMILPSVLLVNERYVKSDCDYGFVYFSLCLSVLPARLKTTGLKWKREKQNQGKCVCVHVRTCARMCIPVSVKFIVHKYSGLPLPLIWPGIIWPIFYQEVAFMIPSLEFGWILWLFYPIEYGKNNTIPVLSLGLKTLATSTSTLLECSLCGKSDTMCNCFEISML